jgi:hypothetical protein
VKVTLDPAALAVMPHLAPKLDGRTINFASLWDGTRWRDWIPTDNGLIEIQVVDVAEGGYFAQNAARADDLYFEFSDFMWKHASWDPVARWLFSIEENIFRVSASFAKIDHFNEFLAGRSERERVEYSRFVSTEVEYLFGRCRSLFDDLQQVVAQLWTDVRLLDPELQKRKKNLPDESFRKAVDRIRAAKQNDEAPYGLPKPLLDAYETVADFFFKLRAIRDELMHRGGRLETIFMVAGGNAVSQDGRLSRLPPKELHVEISEKLVSLRPVIAHLFFRTLNAFNVFAIAFSKVIRFPEDMFPDHHYFLRAPQMHALAAAQEALKPRSDEAKSDPVVPGT